MALRPYMQANAHKKYQKPHFPDDHHIRNPNVYFIINEYEKSSKQYFCALTP
jgi:hypothetical protein